MPLKAGLRAATRHGVEPGEEPTYTLPWTYTARLCSNHTQLPSGCLARTGTRAHEPGSSHSGACSVGGADRSRGLPGGDSPLTIQPKVRPPRPDQFRRLAGRQADDGMGIPMFHDGDRFCQCTMLRPRISGVTLLVDADAGSRPGDINQPRDTAEHLILSIETARESFDRVTRNVVRRTRDAPPKLARMWNEQLPLARGCHETQPLRRPARVRWAVVSIQVLVTVGVALGAACGQERSTPGLPTLPTSPPSTVTLTGMVVDAAGSPVQDARVGAFPLTGWTASWAVAQPLTDGSGRFRNELPHHDGPVYVAVYKTGYVQPCAAAVRFPSETMVTVSMTNAVLTTDLPMAPNLRHVSGVVYEITAAGRRPVPGVDVGWETVYSGNVAAYTQTDEQGRYRLCGLPRTAIDFLYAYAFSGRSYVHARVGDGGDAVIDFEVQP